jgi:ubiquinone/menaquinone biosynthesis C-methylase UbiE
MWTVLSDPEKDGVKWDPEEFFATGADVLERIKAIEDSGIEIGRRVAVDFGCGLGRVSRWLAKRFSSVVGVDISPTMLEMAERYNTQSAPITFVLGNETHIPLATSCADFVHSVIALQHIPRRLQEMYLREFSRIARPGGHLYFQTPSHALFVKETAFRLDRNTDSGPASIELHTYPRAEVEALMEGCGCEVMRTLDDDSCGPGIKSHFYLARKRS